MGHKDDLDNHSNQCNPNTDVYWESRGEDERPDDWEEKSNYKLYKHRMGMITESYIEGLLFHYLWCWDWLEKYPHMHLDIESHFGKIMYKEKEKRPRIDLRLWERFTETEKKIRR